MLCQKKSFRRTKRWEQFSGVEVRLPHPFPVVEGKKKGGKITVVTVRVGSGRLVKRQTDLAERWEGARLSQSGEGLLKAGGGWRKEELGWQVRKWLRWCGDSGRRPCTGCPCLQRRGELADKTSWPQ